MKKHIAILAAAVSLITAFAAQANEPASRVCPANLPIPLSSSKPVYPVLLRNKNLFDLSMTGEWKFSLTHGQIVNEKFQSSDQEITGIRASSFEDPNSPENAFDSNGLTRWCASDSNFPQWIEVDFKEATRVDGVTLAWEFPNLTYQCVVEGSSDRKKWTPLYDALAGGGIGDGDFKFAPAAVRSVRLKILKCSGQGWASLWELGIHYLDDNGKDEIWKPLPENQRPLAGDYRILASSYQNENPPQNAFDESSATRWCASSGETPQWIELDIKNPLNFDGAKLSWERPSEKHKCLILGSDDGKNWRTLYDASRGDGAGSELLSFPAANVSKIRLSVLGSSEGGWASLWEIGLRYRDKSGAEQIWSPSAYEASLPAPETPDFATENFSDSTWNTLAVPSNWEMAGYSMPTYNSFDDTVGLYRRWVDIPAAWKGRRIYWRFDGAMDGAEIFVNGVKAGYHESGFTAFDVDLTGLVRPGEKNLFAVRLSKETPSSDCETGDFQMLGGIYRDTSLIAVPETHVADITIRTPLKNGYRDADLNADLKISGKPGQKLTVRAELYDADGRAAGVAFSTETVIGDDGAADAALSASATAPKLWSAEKPNLYYVVFELSDASGLLERTEQRFGFREEEIRDHVLYWNGKPIKCTGICRHDFWYDKGFALTDAQWNTDLHMMKAANINAIRTSHYNHAARFLELCDEQGFYILDEVPFCWVGDKVKDPGFAPPLLLRAADTVERDKNRPCVLAWSLGNENPVGIATQKVFDLVKKLDPTRPAFASCSGPWDIQGQEVRDMHYPSPGDLRHFIDVDSSKAVGIITEHPHVMYTKESQDFDPGVTDLWSVPLIKTWKILWSEPHIIGSFIWEWQNQGIADKYDDHDMQFWYGKDHLRQENNKGIVTSAREPKAELWIVKNAYSPIEFDSRTVKAEDGYFSIGVKNHYSFTNLSELRCKWTAYNGKTAVRSGELKADCDPMDSSIIKIPATACESLRVEFWNGAREIIACVFAADNYKSPEPPAALTDGDPFSVSTSGDQMRVSNDLQTLVISKKSGMIASWKVKGADLIASEATLNLGEEKAARWDEFFKHDGPVSLQCEQISSEPQSDGSLAVNALSDVLDAPGGSLLGKISISYLISKNGEIKTDWNLNWLSVEKHFWETGFRFPVSSNLAKMTWSRDSFFTDYPAGQLGEPTGECDANSTQFHASKSKLHWLNLESANGGGLCLIQSDTPLSGRGEKTPGGGLALLASGAIAAAGPDDLSRSWFSEYEIVASKEKPLSGGFILRATVSNK